MSIEQTLERIVEALEELIKQQDIYQKIRIELLENQNNHLDDIARAIVLGEIKSK